MGMTAHFDPGDKWRRLQSMLDDPEPLLKSAGVAAVADSQQAFSDQGWGEKKWPERMVPNFAGIIRDLMEGSPQPKPGRLDPGPALLDSGTLAGSFGFNRIAHDAIVAGTNVEYAEKQAKGGPSKLGPWDESVRTKLWRWLKRQDKSTRGMLGWLLSKKWLIEPVTINIRPRKFVGMTKNVIEAVELTLAER